MSTVEKGGVLGSVSVWIHDLRAGSETAAANLFKRYFPNIRGLARRELGGFPARIADDEDLAMDVFNTLFQAVRNGRFEGMKDRQHMWTLMVLITRKATIDHKRFETRGKRDIKKRDDWVEPISDDESPEQIAAAKEQQQRLFDILRTDELRKIAAAKLEGYSNEEIANTLGVAPRTIQRKVNIIYEQWESELDK